MSDVSNDLPQKEIDENNTFVDIPFNEVLINNEINHENVEYNDNIYAYLLLIEKVQKIIKIFRRSSVKNDELEKIQGNNKKKIYKLHLDIQIRWNSLIIMINSFINMYQSVN